MWVPCHGTAAGAAACAGCGERCRQPEEALQFLGTLGLFGLAVQVMSVPPTFLAKQGQQQVGLRHARQRQICCMHPATLRHRVTCLKGCKFNGQTEQ